MLRNTLLRRDWSAYSFVKLQWCLKLPIPASLSTASCWPPKLPESWEELEQRKAEIPKLGHELCTMVSALSPPSYQSQVLQTVKNIKFLETKSGTSNAPDWAAGFESTAPAFGLWGAHSQSVSWPLAWCLALYLGSAVTSWASPVCGIKQYLLQRLKCSLHSLL